MKPSFPAAARLSAVVLVLSQWACGGGETVAPGVATTLAANSNASYSAVAGSPVAPPPSVIVRDQHGNGMAGVAVNFTVTSGSGTVTGASATTNSAGIATVGGWTLGMAAGINSLTASSGSLTPVIFTAASLVGAPASLTKTLGDNQTGRAGTILPIAPAVTVKDASGNVVSGVVVTFTVASGGGTVTGAAATSNGAGVATVGGWTLGSTAGANSLTASASGVPSVTFTALGTANTCPAPGTHTFGTTTNGALETTDCQFTDGSYVDFYATVVPAATPAGESGAYLFKQSATFNTYLLLISPDATPLAENDDESSTSANSTIKAILPAGSYRLGAGSFDPNTTGSYSLSSGTTTTDVINCEEVFLARGVTTTQNIQASDCLWNMTPIYADIYFIYLKAGQPLTVSMASAAVDSFLELYLFDASGNATPVASNDNKDASGTKDAQIVYTPTTAGYYAIIARTGVSSQVGSYLLTVQ